MSMISDIPTHICLLLSRRSIHWVPCGVAICLHIAIEHFYNVRRRLHNKAPRRQCQLLRNLQTHVEPHSMSQFWRSLPRPRLLRHLPWRHSLTCAVRSRPSSSRWPSLLPSPPPTFCCSIPGFQHSKVAIKQVAHDNRVNERTNMPAMALSGVATTTLLTMGRILHNHLVGAVRWTSNQAGSRCGRSRPAVTATIPSLEAATVRFSGRRNSALWSSQQRTPHCKRQHITVLKQSHSPNRCTFALAILYRHACKMHLTSCSVCTHDFLARGQLAISFLSHVAQCRSPLQITIEHLACAKIGSNLCVFATSARRNSDVSNELY